MASVKNTCFVFLLFVSLFGKVTLVPQTLPPGLAQLGESFNKHVGLPFRGLLKSFNPESSSSSSDDESEKDAESSSPLQAEDLAEIDVSAGQCPCYQENGQTVCVAYDPSYQATTLEECLTNFVDTAEPDSKKARSVAPKPKGKAKGTNAMKQSTEFCEPKDVQCKACTKKILKRFQVNSDFKGVSVQNFTIGEISDLFKQNKLDGVNENDCTMFQEINDVINNEVNQAFGKCFQDIGNLNVIKGKNNSKNKKEDEGQDFLTTLSSFFPGTSRSNRARTVRQISSEVEKTYTINCRRRGESVESGSSYVGLCDICWKWGVLESSFTPQYINLMTCGTNTRCLSGWGRCRQRYRSFQVLKNYGSRSSPRYYPYTINIPMACDCQVQSGSALHNFVKG